MPRPVSDAGVVVSGRAEMHDVLHAGSLRRVHEGIALLEHVDGIACQHEDAVDAFERWSNRLFTVVVESHDRHAQAFRFLWIASGCDDLKTVVVGEEADKLAANLPGCTCHKDLSPAGHILTP